MKQLLFSTIALQTNSKVVIDAKNILESSLTNNLVLVTSFLPLNYNSPAITAQNLSTVIDKGANFLRTSVAGASSQSIIQLEYQPCTLNLKQIRDISEYIKNNVAPKYFQTLIEKKGKNEYDIHF